MSDFHKTRVREKERKRERARQLVSRDKERLRSSSRREQQRSLYARIYARDSHTRRYKSPSLTKSKIDSVGGEEDEEGKEKEEEEEKVRGMGARIGGWRIGMKGKGA